MNLPTGAVRADYAQDAADVGSRLDGDGVERNRYASADSLEV